MQINIYTSSLPSSWQKEAAAEYIRRISRFSRVTLKEGDLTKVMPEIIASPDGKGTSSEEFSEIISSLMMKTSEISILIEGKDEGNKVKNEKIPSIRIKLIEPRLSPETEAVLLLEQIYRAFKIMKGEIYHK